MTKTFKVAGHLFNFSMRDTCTLWKHLSQYDPFAVGYCDNPVFNVTLVEGEAPETPGTLIYDPETEPGETVVRVFQNSGGWAFETSPASDCPLAATLVADADFTEGRLYLATRSVSLGVFGINNALMLMYAFRTITMGTLEVHASMIGNSGRAYLFMAKSGTGKSTHSSLWLRNVPGSELMNDDNPVVRVWPDGRVIAYGSPWSGKTPCYRNVEAPVGAFVRINRAPADSIEELGLLESYALIHSSTSGIKFNEKMADGLHASLQQILDKVPCYVMNCLPDAEAALVCSRKVLNNGI